MASRLHALGVSDACISKYLRYCPNATETWGKAASLVDAVLNEEPDLVVFDSLADFTSAAGLNENDNTEMTAWVKQTATPLNVAGVTTLALDHVAKASDGKYQRGASAKKAKSDAVWRLDVTQAFSVEDMGEIEVVRAKDRLGYLPSRITYGIGGNGVRSFVERRQVHDAQAERDARHHDEAVERRAFCSRVAEILSGTDTNSMAREDLVRALGGTAQKTRQQVVANARNLYPSSTYEFRKAGVGFRAHLVTEENQDAD
jgi:hypothetical protein